jgi:hypothetical protein
MDRVDRTDAVLVEVLDERARQDAKFGEQNWPDGTGPSIPWPLFVGDGTAAANRARERCDQRAKDGSLTFRDIAVEEIAEAFAEDKPARLRTELVQSAAMLVAWIEAIDRRAAQ